MTTKSKTIKIDGQLEIDPERGVIYFHSSEQGHSALRICGLPTPIPDPSKYGEGLDITISKVKIFTIGIELSWRGREDG